MNKYHFAFSDIETLIPLDESTLEDLSGSYPGSLQSLQSIHKLPRKCNWLCCAERFYYIPSLGLVDFTRWKEYLPSEFLSFNKTITQVCVEWNISRSFDRFLHQSSSYVEFVSSPAYKHMLGVLNHTSHVQYGKIANTRKTTNIRHCDRTDVSSKRVEQLLIANEVTLLEPWKGTRNADGSICYYHVRCNRCGQEYTTWLHSRDLKVCPSCKQGKFSAVRESIMKLYIESLGFKVFQSYRSLIKGPTGYPSELDLYLPDEKVAFEFNGYYYHVATGVSAKDVDYHKRKTEECLKNGVRLYHIWSDTPDDLCKSLIQAKLGKSTRIYARKCSLGASTHEFLELNHVDGDCRALKRWSLWYNNQEVCQLSVRRHKEGLEIARFATLKGFEVVGGYSRLLHHMIQKYAIPEGFTKIITYCNRDLSPDPLNNFYARIGFKFEGVCSNILKYVTKGPVTLNGVTYKSNTVVSRQRCQKHLLLKHLGLDDSPLNEAQLAESLGLYQVFNSGNFKYSLDLASYTSFQLNH